MLREIFSRSFLMNKLSCKGPTPPHLHPPLLSFPSIFLRHSPFIRPPLPFLTCLYLSMLGWFDLGSPPPSNLLLVASLVFLYNLVYFLPHSCFLYLTCFSSFPQFAPTSPPPPFLQASGSSLLL